MDIFFFWFKLTFMTRHFRFTEQKQRLAVLEHISKNLNPARHHTSLCPSVTIRRIMTHDEKHTKKKGLDIFLRMDYRPNMRRREGKKCQMLHVTSLVFVKNRICKDEMMKPAKTEHECFGKKYFELSNVLKKNIYVQQQT